MKEAYQIKEIRGKAEQSTNGSVIGSGLDDVVMSSKPEFTYKGRKTDTIIPYQAWNPLPGPYMPPMPPPIMPPQSPGMPGYPGYGPNVFSPADKTAMNEYQMSIDDWKPAYTDFRINDWPLPSPDVIPQPSPGPAMPLPTPYPHP